METGQEKPEDILKEFALVREVPVLWGDLDALNHVNNTVYFRYFETGRIAYFEETKLVDWNNVTGIGPILASTRCDFKIPLTYPDKVTVAARVRKIGGTSLIMDHLVYSHKLQAVAATGEAILVLYDYLNGKKVPVPDEIRQSIRTFQGGKVEE